MSVDQLKFLISIPTLNSEKTLAATLDSVMAQTYGNFACNIVDSNSQDGTVSIARERGVDVIVYGGKLLGARRVGFQDIECDFVIFLDSDQVLERTALERLADLLRERELDMVILEERSYRRDNWVQKMYDLDHRLVHRDYEYNVSPTRGVLLPRVFRTALLARAFSNIDHGLDAQIVAHDHAIIYYECSLLSDRIGVLSNSVFHQDLSRLRDVFKHFARYGSNTRDFERAGLYTDIIHQKMSGRARGVLRRFSGKKILTLPLLFVKGAGYYYGYYSHNR